MARIEIIPDDSWDYELGEIHPRVVDPAYADRIADGLGIETESWIPD